ncbi:putative ribonuclease H-like domain-containing protein [Tanacetum coccineum]
MFKTKAAREFIVILLLAFLLVVLILLSSISAGPAEIFPTVIEPVHADKTSLPPGHSLEDKYALILVTGIFSSSSYDADFGGTVTNLAPIVAVDPVPTKRVNTIHPQSQILGDLTSPVQTRGTLKKSKFGESTFVTLSLNDSDWVEAMQEEMQQFINQKVWKLVPLPDGKIAIGTKWILKNKRDARGIVVRNKARLVAQGHRQEEGIDYEELFAPVAKYEAIRTILSIASFMGFNALYGLPSAPRPGSLMYLTASRPDIMFAKVDLMTSVKKQTNVGGGGGSGLLLQLKQNMLQLLTVVVRCIIHEGGLALFKCYSWTVWPSFDDKEFILFWSTASLRAPELGPPAILATIDRTPYTITEDTHCLSTKSGSWDQFGSPLAIALICLSDGRRFNWSGYIFKGMVNNISNAKRFLMYPRGPHATFSCRQAERTECEQCPGYTYRGSVVTGEAAPDVPQTIPETIHETRPEPDKSQEHIPTPPRPTTSDQIPPVFEQGRTSDPNIASFSGAHESDPDLFHYHIMWQLNTGRISPQPTSQKVSTLESELKAHKLLFKDVVGKLVKKVKSLDLKLKTRSQKVVMRSLIKNREERAGCDPIIKLLRLLLLQCTPVDVSPGADIPPSPPLPTGMSAGVSSGISTGTPAGTSNKGKSPIMEVDPSVKRRTFRQMKEDWLGKEAAKRLLEEEHADLERQRAEMQRKRQQDVLDSAKYYTDADWTDIMGQVHANQGLTSDLLGPDVNEDNFAERMVALIAERRRAFAAQRFQEKRNKPLTYAQQKAYMRTFIDNPKTSGDFLRAGEDLEHDVSKKPKPTEVPMSSQPDVPQQQATNVPPVDPQQPSESSSQPNVSMSSGPEKKGHTYGTRRKSLGTRKKSSTALDLDADDKSFIRVLFNDDSDDDDDPVIFSLLLLLGRWEILHLVDRQDLLKLYGMVVKYYEDHPLAGVGMMLGVYFSDEVISSFSSTYEEDAEAQIDGVGNDMTYAELLIQFIKHQIAASIPSA